MKQRRWIFLLLTIALLALGWFLSRCSEDKQPERAKASQTRVFPREQRRHRGKAQTERQRQRQKTVDGSIAPSQKAQNQTIPQDGFERAYNDPKSGALLSVQVNAIRNSELATKIMRCREQELSPSLKQVQEALGIDPLQDIDRLALGENVVVMSGFFSGLRVPESFGEGQDLGQNAQLYTLPLPEQQAEEGPTETYLAVVDDQLILLGNTRQDIDDSIARIHDPEPSDNAMLDDELNSSDLGGFLGPGFVQKLLGDNPDDPLSQQISQTVQNARFRANVDDAVMISTDLTGTDAAQVKDLSQSIAGGLSAMRLKAAHEGDQDLATLLDLARVKQEEENGELSPNIALDLAVPGHQILNALGCDDDGLPLPGRKVYQGDPQVPNPNTQVELEGPQDPQP